MTATKRKAAIAESADYDYIVVGAGSAGAALAGRLSEDGTQRVLVVDAGHRDDWIWLRIPAGLIWVLTDDRAVIRFETDQESGLSGRRIWWPRGRVLGGSGRVNGMIWVRGDPAEFDHWLDLGNYGWGYRDVLPYFRRMETYQAGDEEVRGRDGPINVTQYSPRDLLSEAFIRACGEMGIVRNVDYNATSMEGADYLQLNTRRGLRCCSYEAYLKPALRRANVSLACDALVTRVTFDGSRATGIEFRQHGEAKWARAQKAVILCAGAIQSPQLLELSGVGAPERLQSLGIPVIVAVPGVGENLRDHLHVRLNLRSRGAVTLNDLMRNPWLRIPEVVRYALHRDGLLACVTCTAHALTRSHPGAPRPDIKLQLHHLTLATSSDPRRILLDQSSGFSIAIFQLRPNSRGSVHLAAADPLTPPRIRANYLTDPEDAVTAVRAFRRARELVAQPSLARFVLNEMRPGAAIDTDEELLAFIRETGTTSYHPMGTCRMGNAPDAVVDPQLKVRGVTGLRVADASIMPTMVSSNINAASIMIGEKCADLILSDRGT